MGQCAHCGNEIVEGAGAGVICGACYQDGWCHRCGKNKADKGFSCSECWDAL